MNPFELARDLRRRASARMQLVPRRLRVAPGDVTIIVLGWNRKDDTLACLESLRKAELDGARVLVVDNGSRDDTADAVRAAFPEVRVIALPENRGYAGGNNAGMRAALAAGARAVLLLNNDTVVEPTFLRPLLDVFNTNARAAAVSGAVLRADSPEVLEVAYLDVYFGHGLVHRRGVNALPGEGFDTVRNVDAALGSCVLIRASALEAIGLLDESFFAYHEEVEWCMRARKAGYEVVFQPYARVWHGGSRSTEALVKPLGAPRTKAGGEQLPNAIPLSWNPVRTYLGARNAVRFIRLHAGIRRRIYFVLSSVYAVPLELLAVVMGREEDLMLGLWTYRRAFVRYCLDPEEGNTGGLGARLLRVPVRLLWSFPRDVVRAHRAGRTAQLVEHCRGLWDGIRDRPLPLERLGLR
jgi:hypothetical protein